MVSQLASWPVSQLNRQTDRQLFTEAEKYLVGGVNSPVRSFQAIGREPIFIKSAKGSKIYSEDGREFIDYCLSWGALILGHTYPKVIEELKKTAERGTSFGAPTKLETELAKTIIEAIPSIENLRFTNSGTEAAMGAIRLARAYTGRNKIIKFQGSYHGHADYLLDCPGVPGDFMKHTLIAEYNNIDKVRALVRQHKKDIAAIIVEPVAANMGVVLPKEGFLQELEKIARKESILFIFDEVITGFRLTFGGAQKLFGVNPDLTCLGKIIGGGLPVGAFGGRKEIMRLLAPEGVVYQAGTFSGNPLTVSAGLTTLKILSENNPYTNLEKQTEYLSKKIRLAAEKSRLELKINFIGSMFSLFFTDNDVTDYQTAKTQDIRIFKKFYHSLLREGVYFSPSPFESNFLSVTHTTNDIKKTLKAIENIFKKIKEPTILK